MGHGHGHAHEHRDPSRQASRSRPLALALGLTLAYMVAEVIGARVSNSLALLADAGHMLSDAAALGLSLFASWIASRPANPRRTYGYYRAEILAALVNGAVLVASAAFITMEAVRRIGNPPEIRGSLVMMVAGGGLLMNLICLRLLMPGRGSNLNVRGAFLHVLSDAVGSVGALMSGLLAWKLGWAWADPVASLLIAALIVWSAWSLLRESVSVLMEGTPGHIDVDELRAALVAVPGVRDVHDLHVWTITSGLESLSGHVTVSTGHSRDVLLAELQAVLAERFHIHHVTLQLEQEVCDVEARH